MGASRPRISDAVRAAVVTDVRARVDGQPTYSEIAAKHGIGLASVRRIADAALGPGVASAMAVDRAKTAREIQTVTAEARRRVIADRLLDFAESCLDEIDNGSVIAGVSFGEIVSGRAGGTTARDRQALATAAAIALDKNRMLTQTSSDNDASDVRKFLSWISGRPLTDQ